MLLLTSCGYFHRTILSFHKRSNTVFDVRICTQFEVTYYTGSDGIISLHWWYESCVVFPMR